MSQPTTVDPETVLSFMDNDKAGHDAQLLLADTVEEWGWTFMPQNHIYEGWNDLNDWWRANPQEHYRYTSGQRPKGSQPGSRNSFKHSL